MPDAEAEREPELDAFRLRVDLVPRQELDTRAVERQRAADALRSSRTRSRVRARSTRRGSPAARIHRSGCRCRCRSNRARTPGSATRRARASRRSRPSSCPACSIVGRLVRSVPSKTLIWPATMSSTVPTCAADMPVEIHSARSCGVMFAGIRDRARIQRRVVEADRRRGSRARRRSARAPRAAA